MPVCFLHCHDVTPFLTYSHYRESSFANGDSSDKSKKKKQQRSASRASPDQDEDEYDKEEDDGDCGESGDEEEEEEEEGEDVEEGEGKDAGAGRSEGKGKAQRPALRGSRCFEVLGLDLMIDKNHKAWLIEVKAQSFLKPRIYSKAKTI